MKKHSINLSPEALDRLAQFDMNIAHWSVQYTTLMLQADQAKATVASLHAARVQTLDKECEANGVNPKDVMKRALNGETLELVVREDEIKPEEG